MDLCLRWRSLRSRIAQSFVAFATVGVLLGPVYATFDNAANASSGTTSYSSCKSKELGKTKSNGSLVCVKIASKHFWVPAFSAADIYAVSDFCSKFLQANLCSWFEQLGYTIVDGQPKSRDVCVRLFREWIYLLKTDLDKGKTVGGSIYYTLSMRPIADRKYPTCLGRLK